MPDPTFTAADVALVEGELPSYVPDDDARPAAIRVLDVLVGAGWRHEPDTLRSGADDLEAAVASDSREWDGLRQLVDRVSAAVWLHARADANMPDPDAARERIDALIEASSLGTPEAKALRESVPYERATAIVERSNEIRDEGYPTPDRAAYAAYQRWRARPNRDAYVHDAMLALATEMFEAGRVAEAARALAAAST